MYQLFKRKKLNYYLVLNSKCFCFFKHLFGYIQSVNNSYNKYMSWITIDFEKT